MIELRGKYTDARIMIDTVDPGVISQTLAMMATEPFTNPVRIMPDTHEGKGSVIGFTEKLNGKVCPNTIGVDIGCGMTAVKYDLTAEYADFSWGILDEQIRKNIPVGFSIHTNKDVLPDSLYRKATDELIFFTKQLNDSISTDYEPIIYDKEYLVNVCKKIGATIDQVYASLGTLGGGNHFIEVDRDEHDNVWSIVHSGSRNFGLKIATYHQRIAGKGDLAFLSGENAYDYFIDMIFAQKFASYSRKKMSTILEKIVGDSPIETIESVHNYIDPSDLIIRKGAISSYEEESIIIPFNMRDGTIICVGKGNPDWNYSAPHGAGRVYSRTQAKKNISIDKFKEDMKEVWSSSICPGTLDEAPDAYKNYKVIMEAIEPTAKIIEVLKPLYNLKG